MNESENRIISLPTFFDDRGNLSMIEQLKQVPFEIRRVYWIYDVPGGVERGGHAQSLHATHRTRGWNGQLQQVACGMEQQGHRLRYRPDTHQCLLERTAHVQLEKGGSGESERLPSVAAGTHRTQCRQ